MSYLYIYNYYNIYISIYIYINIYIYIGNLGSRIWIVFRPAELSPHSPESIRRALDGLRRDECRNTSAGVETIQRVSKQFRSNEGSKKRERGN